MCTSNAKQVNLALCLSIFATVVSLAALGAIFAGLAS